MLDTKDKVAVVKEQIEEKIRHPYLLKYIQSPYIDEDKVLLLVSILDHVNLSGDKLKNYAITTMLIQIALDTHELVTKEKLDAAELKNRQLTVLAGVYYSGLYYKILAGLDDIHMIRLLATGIKEVNEHKISVYQQASEAVDILMDSVRRIESSLFEKISELLDDPNWSEFVSNLLFHKRLMKEKVLFLQGGSSVVFEALKNLLFPNSDYSNACTDQRHVLIHTCDRYIESSKRMLEKYMSKLPMMNELLAHRVQAIINQHHPAGNIFVEEG
ncbi:heptaprenyl diphosphate synthase component 1 [Cytobacillus depressus]|uniref:Heptaprenyl diphosphate synthase component 1 n=1 Tax=Cytobacillus depressus TaxID=1602942 RepID=A0A6L3V9G7_9BACI|nr:heptaprenyl diphosphate synthase component 1 [Cytobacillus depressus]KAB2338326.1 heptaprenyl diphosphate synthase component 1 [Cytobacillus depressus]